MLAECLLAASFQVGPFYEQRPDFRALRPICSREGETTDVLWPLFTRHRDWWRLCYLIEGHRSNDESSFAVMPFWWSGVDRDEGDWWAFFPFWGHHPHFLLMDDFDFALWPLWHAYSTPRATGGRMRTNAVLWPFFHWRSDGSWGVWPLAGLAHQRESDHRYALWPFVTWAGYRADRDTAGAGSSWMVWPLAGGVTREREDQWMFLPPFFSYARTRSRRGDATNDVSETRLRCPWPFFEKESSPRRDRISVFPFYERTRLKPYASGETASELLGGTASVPPADVTRFGWKLVELYPDETRVFPFWVSRKDGSYFRLWPLWESETRGEVTSSRALSLCPIRWANAVERNWSAYWTFYRRESDPVATYHSLLWGLIRWRTLKE